MANKFLTYQIPAAGQPRANAAVAPLAGSLRNMLNLKVQQYESLRLLSTYPPGNTTSAQIVTAAGLTAAQIGRLLSLMKGEIISAASILGDTAPTWAADDAVVAATITV